MTVDYNDRSVGLYDLDLQQWQSDHMKWILSEIEKVKINEKKEHFEKEEDLFKI